MIYKRILLKISGEIFKGEQESGLDGAKIRELAEEVKKIKDGGVEIGIVIGGGNIWRFRDFRDMDFLSRTRSDTMGMLATIMNAIVFAEMLNSIGVKAKALSKLRCEALEDYDIENAKKYLDDGYVLIFAGGTGSPFFTTDSASALRALEIGADVLLKATKVDYVYDKDPMKFDDAVKFENLTFDDVVEKKLGVMDLTCAALCRDGGMPMRVFNLNKKGNIEKILNGENIGTLIKK